MRRDSSKGNINSRGSSGDNINIDGHAREVVTNEMVDAKGKERTMMMKREEMEEARAQQGQEEATTHPEGHTFEN